MTKALVKTTGDFLIMDPYTGEQVKWNRPTVVTWSGHLEGKLAGGDLKVLLGNLPMDASDEDFVKFLADSDGKEALAVAAFESANAPEVSIAEAIELLEEGDFQKNGKPKLGALEKVLGRKVTAEERDDALAGS